jgi:hypothetical protein
VITLADGKSASNVLHGSYTTTPPALGTLATTLFNSLSNAWSTNLAAHMHAGTQFVRVEIRDMAAVTNPIFIGTGAAIPGTAAGAALPAEMACVITENVSKRGRGLKGRIYIGGFDITADAGNGVIAPTTKTALDNYATALFTAVSAGGLSPCVAELARAQYQGLTGTVHPARVDGPAAVSSYTVRDDHWDSQRRRGLK